MGRRPGRPRKDRTEESITKLNAVDDILTELKYSNSDLTDAQISALRAALDNTLGSYSVEKSKEKEKTTKDINVEVLEEFLATKRIESKSHTTIYNYGNEISKMMVTLNKDYREITSQDIRSYLDYRKQHDKVSAVTVKNIRMYLMSFFKWCTIEEKILRNPMDKIGVIKTEKHIVETLSDEEAEIIRCACKSERDIAIIDLLSSSGMRVSELSGLNRDDVNFDTGEIKVFGKGSKERICYMTGRAKVHLKWYLESRADLNPALFVTAKKPYNRLSKNGVEFLLKSIAKQSRIPRTRLYPHKYRSTLATNMYNKGASIDQVQHILGHQSGETTQLYIAIDNKRVADSHHTYVS